MSRPIWVDGETWAACAQAGRLASSIGNTSSKALPLPSCARQQPIQTISKRPGLTGVKPGPDCLQRSRGLPDQLERVLDLAVADGAGQGRMPELRASL